jgi:hypothetical protein
MLMGGVVSTPALMAILNGCTAKPTIDWKPVFFTEDQGIAVTQLADIIMPATDTPGAKDVGVPAFIESIIKDCYKQEDQERFMSGLQVFMEGPKDEYGNEFIKLNAEDQLKYVTDVHAGAVEAEKNKADGYKRPFILMHKELTMLGFLTSQVGAEQVLQYQAVPGSYEGCITLEEAGGKTWAS